MHDEYMKKVLAQRSMRSGGQPGVTIILGGESPEQQAEEDRKSSDLAPPVKDKEMPMEGELQGGGEIPQEPVMEMGEEEFPMDGMSAYDKEELQGRKPRSLGERVRFEEMKKAKK